VFTVLYNPLQARRVGFGESPRFCNGFLTPHKHMNDLGKSAATRQAEGLAYIWWFGQVEFDEPNWRLIVGGRDVEAELKPLEVLAFLLRHAGEVVTKEELLEAVWPGVIVVEAAVANAVAKLRKALGEDSQQCIVTVHKVGYRFAGALRRKSITHPVPMRIDLKPGAAVPGRPQWRVTELLGVNPGHEVWLASHTKTSEQRVFKFTPDVLRLSALKCGTPVI